MQLILICDVDNFSCLNLKLVWSLSHLLLRRERESPVGAEKQRSPTKSFHLNLEASMESRSLAFVRRPSLFSQSLGFRESSWSRRRRSRRCCRWCRRRRRRHRRTQMVRTGTTAPTRAAITQDFDVLKETGMNFLLTKICVWSVSDKTLLTQIVLPENKCSETKFWSGASEEVPSLNGSSAKLRCRQRRPAAGRRQRRHRRRRQPTRRPTRDHRRHRLENCIYKYFKLSFRNVELRDGVGRDGCDAKPTGVWRQI